MPAISDKHWQTTTGHVVPYGIDSTGTPRLMGCKAPRPNFGGHPRLAEVVGIIPVEQWEQVDLAASFPCTILDQGQTNSCFPAGTLIRMADGTQRPIEQVRLLDRVLTAEGNLGTVTDLMVRQDKAEVVRLYLYGHRHLRATPEHPVLTDRGYVPIGELNIGDWVAIPKFAPRSTAVLQTADHVAFRRNAREEARNADRIVRYVGVVGRRSLTIVSKKLPDAIGLTEGFGRILGYFIAEGNATASTVSWTFHKDEAETHVADLRRLLTDELGVESNLSINDARNTAKVAVYGTAWSRLFESLCGTGSSRKRLDADITSGPEDFLRGVLSAWFNGDGYERRGRRFITTVSHAAALGAFDILAALGFAPAIRRTVPKLSHGVASREVRWDIEWTEEFGETYRCRQDERHAWRRVCGTEREDHEGPVYNFEVEGDNSYVAEGIGVHNCVGHGAKTAAQRAFMKAGKQDVPELSACFTYAQINGDADDGAVVSDAMAELIQTGICSAATVPEGIIFRSQIPEAAYEEAARWRAEECYHCGTFEEIGTAILLGYTVADGIACDNAFLAGQLDPEGVAPHGGVPVGRHCTESHGLKRTKAGVWVVKKQNSWSAQWGMDGYFFVSEAGYAWQQGNQIDAFALRLVRDDPQDPDNPPPVVA